MTAIETFRKAKGLTQQKLADALHVTQGSVNHWENGRASPGIDKLKAMAKLFNCTVDDLLEEHSA